MLDQNSLPIEKAVESFSTSITYNTQTGYATATRHYFEAEKALGRKFGHPPSESDLIFLITYLINLNLTVPTIRNYWSGIRYYLLSLGISTPPQAPSIS